MVRRYVTCTCLFALPLLALGEPRSFELEDLFEVPRVVDVAIAPDGSRIAVTVERHTRKSYHLRSALASRLWLVTANGDAPQPLVTGAEEVVQTRPAWSADGELLAYTARVEGEPQTLRLIRMEQAPRSPTTLAVCGDGESVGTYAWSPREPLIVAVCDRPMAREAEETPTTIIASQSSLYAGTAMPTVERHVVLYDVESRRRTVLIRDDSIINAQGALSWVEPDTLWVTGTTRGHYAGSEYTGRRLIHRVDLISGAVSTLPAEPDNLRFAAADPSGTKLAIQIGGSVGIREWRQTWLLIPMALRIVAEDGRVLSTAEQPEMYLHRQLPPVWVASPERTTDGVVYFGWWDHASGRVKAYHPASGRWTDVTPEGVNVDAFSVTPDGSRMALVQGDANTPAEVYLLDLTREAARPKRLTRFGDRIHERYAVSTVEPMRWRSKDDRFNVHGWLLKPSGYVPGQRYPLIVDVHGGPGVFFKNRFETFRFEGGHQIPPEIYAARGYLVLMVNPRGDPSYGRAYQEALREGWEHPTRFDILPGVDEAVRRGYANPERLGIAGASYGGWVAAYAVSQTDQFKAGSANDPVIDSNISSAVAYRGDQPSNYWMHAGMIGGHLGDLPFPTVDPRLVETPMLLRFGVKQWESTHPSQFFTSGLPYFTYLHTHCVPVEMIMHTEEGHGIYDPDTWRNYIDRDLAWFDYWLLGKGPAPVVPRECDG